MTVTKNILRVIIVAICIATISSATSMPSVAETGNWMTGDPRVEAENTTANESCTAQDIEYTPADTVSPYDIVPPKSGWACITEGEDIDVANDSYGTMYVRKRGEQTFTILSTEATGRLQKGTNFYSYIRNTSDFGLFTVADLSTALKVSRSTALGQVLLYSINPSAITHRLPISAAAGYRKVFSYQISKSMRYLVAYVDYQGIVKLDLNDNTVTKIAIFQGTPLYHAYIPNVEAVSNDGRYVFMGNSGIVIDTELCGDMLEGEFKPENAIKMPCGSSYLDNAISAKVQYSYKITKAEFIDDYIIKFLVWPWGPSPSGVDRTNKWVTLYAAGYDPDAFGSLAYLALGDSYSSGEGDVAKNEYGGSYYMYGTESAGGCHVSSRSYPYLLKDVWNIPTNRMRSIACSGATILPDMYGTASSYYGQNRQLVGMPAEKVKERRENALEQFTPGDIPQIEFVRKYQPKVVTLTGGGNDVGFANILSYCAYGSLNIEGFWNKVKEGLYGTATCSFVNPNSVAQKITLRAIADQYIQMGELIKKIKKASPDTKVYVIGYPEFIASTSFACRNGLELDAKERKTINYFTRLLNNKLKSAALDNASIYIDTSKSLDGGRLCEGSKYVTGILNVDINNYSEMKGLFHPNAAGHAKIAEAIIKGIKNVGGDESPLDAPDTVGDAYDGRASSAQMTESNLSNKENATLSLKPDSFAPGTKGNIIAYSDPIKLGEVIVASDGSINTVIDTTKLGSGFHLLTIEGLDVDGIKTMYYQFVTVGLSDTTEDAASENPNRSTNAADDEKSVNNEKLAFTVSDTTKAGAEVVDTTASDAVNDHIFHAATSSVESSNRETSNSQLLLIIGIGAILMAGCLYRIWQSFRKTRKE